MDKPVFASDPLRLWEDFQFVAHEVAGGWEAIMVIDGVRVEAWTTEGKTKAIQLVLEGMVGEYK